MLRLGSTLIEFWRIHFLQSLLVLSMASVVGNTKLVVAIFKHSLLSASNAKFAVSWCRGNPASTMACKIWACPYQAAVKLHLSSKGAPCPKAQIKHSKFPPAAAARTTKGLSQDPHSLNFSKFPQKAKCALSNIFV